MTDARPQVNYFLCFVSFTVHSKPRNNAIMVSFITSIFVEKETEAQCQPASQGQSRTQKPACIEASVCKAMRQHFGGYKDKLKIPKIVPSYILSYKNKKEHSINTPLPILVISAKIRLVNDIRTWFVFMTLQSLSQHLTTRLLKTCWILQIAFSGMFSPNDNTD